MLGNDDVAGQTLETRKLDVFTTHDLEHARAGEPQQGGGEIPTEGQRRHEEVAPVALAAGGQPLQVHREYEDQHESEPKAGYRQAQKRDDLAGLVPNAVDAHSREQAGWDAYQEGKQSRRKGELKRVGQALKIKLAYRHSIV